MTPTETVAPTVPKTTRRLLMYPGIDVSFVRDSSSTAGTLGEADRAVPYRVRVIVRTALRQWGLPGLIEPAELLATELVTNAFRHGLGDVGVRLYVTASDLLVEVRDGSSVRPVPSNAALDAEHGRGLLLVTAIADHWGVSPDGTTTWCSLPF
ncbi:anti-sigma regulatory factor (Ser/Thr protein kinase) [Streptomyces sp. SAI-208]|uniref:ATP-binding protein n=1 Tax=Streptomyces sp. SAI-208 TaxID=2940550 RepID=UPI002473FF67|nr:ATP-binding protein [Streptomyces sp. SAI-208]MDH6612890.1 anti-sigma regulatory factor (Ser/Thr protein kinase) [Streptomyces sp. SAI-208]